MAASRRRRPPAGRFAWTIAKDEPHAINAPYTLDRFHRGILIDEKGQGSTPRLHYRTNSPCSSPVPIAVRATSSEFTYQGDGNRTRPDPASTDQEAWNAYVYDRLNTAGDHHEIWQHSGGCRAHLAVTRNTLTHKISSVGFARDAGHRKSDRHRKSGSRA